jgi:hypothetical protein
LKWALVCIKIFELKKVELSKIRDAIMRRLDRDDKLNGALSLNGHKKLFAFVKFGPTVIIS